MPKQRTKADMVALRAAIAEILQADHPQTVRQVFYRHQLSILREAERSERSFRKMLAIEHGDGPP
jgi:DNA topoisomerase VI subunit A